MFPEEPATSVVVNLIGYIVVITHVSDIMGELIAVDVCAELHLRPCLLATETHSQARLQARYIHAIGYVSMNKTTASRLTEGCAVQVMNTALLDEPYIILYGTLRFTSRPPSLRLTSGDAVREPLVVGSFSLKMFEVSTNRTLIEAVTLGLLALRDLQIIESSVMSSGKLGPVACIIATPAELSKSVDRFPLCVAEEGLGVNSCRIDSGFRGVISICYVFHDVFLCGSDHIVRVPVRALPALQAVEHVRYGSVFGLRNRVGMLCVFGLEVSRGLIHPRGEVRSAHRR